MCLLFVKDSSSHITYYYIIIIAMLYKLLDVNITTCSVLLGISREGGIVNGTLCLSFNLSRTAKLPQTLQDVSAAQH